MSTLPAAGYIENASRTNAENKAAFEAMRDIMAESVGGEARTELTIASGAVTPPEGSGGGIFTLDTEGGAGTDTLDTIAQTNTRDGQIIYLMAENASRVVTVNHAAGGTGQILLLDSTDFVFASLLSWVMLQRRGTDWVELARYVPMEDLTAVTALTSSDLVEVWDDSAGTVVRTPATQVGHIVQMVEGTPYTNYVGVVDVIPGDNSIPQSGEGAQILSVSITPKSATNRLVIQWSFWGSIASGGIATAALFQDATAGALNGVADGGSAGDLVKLDGSHEMAAGTTSSTTFKVRVGPSTAAVTLYTNGLAANRLFGGVSAGRIRVTEYAS